MSQHETIYRLTQNRTKATIHLGRSRRELIECGIHRIFGPNGTDWVIEFDSGRFYQIKEDSTEFPDRFRTGLRWASRYPLISDWIDQEYPDIRDQFWITEYGTYGFRIESVSPERKERRFVTRIVPDTQGNVRIQHYYAIKDRESLGLIVHENEEALRRVGLQFDGSRLVGDDSDWVVAMTDHGVNSQCRRIDLGLIANRLTEFSWVPAWIRLDGMIEVL